MKQIKDVEEKQRIASEIQDLVKKINQLMDDAPAFLKIEFEQNRTGFSKNPHLCVFISETIAF